MHLQRETRDENTFVDFVTLIGGVSSALAEESAQSRIDSITKSARDTMPAMPSMPSVSVPRQ
jgi:hypothetical protein